MRASWLGRWVGVACGVAGCAPMLAGLVGGVAGAVGAQAMGSAASMASMASMGPVAPMAGASMAGGMPGWVLWLGRFSWPLLIASAALLVVSFWRTRPLPRVVAYAGVALLIVNQTDMTPWLFLPALALVLLAFLLASSRAWGRAPVGLGRR